MNIGQPRTGFTRSGSSGIVKEPTTSIEVRDPGSKQGGLGSGVLGDAVINRAHHGGRTQAVYAVAREELDWWGQHLGRELPDGMFGENLTTEGLDVDGAVLGERWAIGDAVVLEVCGPRVPCSTFAARMGERQWVKRFTHRGRTGAYLAVVTPGTIAPGDVVQVVHRPMHGITVPDAFAAWCGDHAAARRILEEEAGPAELRAELAARLPRQP